MPPGLIVREVFHFRNVFMTTSFLNSETLRRSLYAQFKCVFWLITIFVVLAAGPALVLTEQSTGSGGAINVSGSLRMMSYRLTVAVSNPYATYAERDKATRDAVKEFGTRLESPSLTASVPLDAKTIFENCMNLCTNDSLMKCLRWPLKALTLRRQGEHFY